MMTTPFYSMGGSSYKVSLDLYKQNRIKLLSKLGEKSGVVYLQGGVSQTRDATDHEPIFRQESFFHYLFGVREPDLRGAIELYSGRSVLFILKLPEDYATFMGEIKTPEQVQKEYGVDEVLYTEDIEGYLSRFSKRVSQEEKKGNDDSCKQIFVLSGVNSDSGKVHQPPELRFEMDTSTLYDILAECRVIKSDSELNLMQFVTHITSMAHVYVMSRVHNPGIMEYQCESLFQHYCYYNFGARHLGYTAICGCGPNSSVLHYGHAGAPNNYPLKRESLLLLDMGAEYCCYGSDVTCTFPIGGTFTERQKVVYQGVLNAQRAVYAMMRPGVSWVDCHKAAEMEIVKALVTLGVVRPETASLKELVNLRLGAVFMPHGLGHLIGIDTHDVGGYLSGHPERSPEPGLKALRTARILEMNMTLTVEPGCYFIPHLIQNALEPSSALAEYLDGEVLKDFKGFGGVRLEDVVAVTENGCVNYTTCPRTIAEVEHVCQGGKWPPINDEAPELRRINLCLTTVCENSSIE